METESFVLNFPRYGDKTFEKVVVIDNKNQNSDKLDFLLDNANQSVQINFLANARIDHLKHFELSMRNEQPNVDWRNGHEKELCIYLNDVFGFKPDQISFQKLDQKPAPNRLPGPSGPPQKNPPKPNSKDKKIRQLEARIRELEEKLRSQPNSPTRQNDQNELNRLKNELSSLKGNNNPQQPNKDKFPYWIVIGGGVIVVFVIGIAFWLGRRRRRHLKNS